MFPIINLTKVNRFSTRYHCYRPCQQEISADHRQPNDENATNHQEERPLLCTVCSTVVTYHKEAFAKNGRHEHLFFNPTGVTFEVRCFQHAPGCLIEGNRTTTFSWFDGFFWQYALCSTCLTHLGWYFSSKEDSFFALISARLFN